MHRFFSKYQFFILAFLSIIFCSCSIGARIKKADKRYEIGEYYAAGELYKKLQTSIPSKKRPLRASVSFKLGESYRLSNNNSKAIRAYAKAISYRYPDSIVYLRYAQSLHKNAQYNEALKNYRMYLKTYPTSKIALDGVESCMQVDGWKKEKTRYVVKRADFFNSKRNSEFCPSFMGGSSISIAITSNRDNKLNKKTNGIMGLPNNNLFVAKKNVSGKWDELSLMEGELNTADDEGVSFFSLDGRVAYFTRCRFEKGASLGAEIFTSIRSGAQWTTPEKVELFSDSSISVAHPAMSPDGKFLYFVSDAPKGLGGKDIWRSEILDKKYGVPENLGEQINTEGDEMFPSFDAKGRLYFSSDGHPGFGGLDIFRTEQDSSGFWSVKNMLSPINSNADDFGITFENVSEKGFFTSNRQQKKGYDKIWSFELPAIDYQIVGFVKDQDGEVLSNATVKLIGSNGMNVKMRTKNDGSYRIPLKSNENYIMLASSRGCLNQQYKLTTAGLSDSKLFKYDFELVSISKPVKMDNVFYEFGKWTLTENSEFSLNQLVKLLNDNPNITIEVSAHTDMNGTEAFNLELSQKRAQSVVDYLIRAKIDPERLTSKGYGKSKPVVADKQLCKKYRFLKEGELLNEEFCGRLTAPQKEIVDQVNRRTEFKVLKTTYKLY